MCLRKSVQCVEITTVPKVHHEVLENRQEGNYTSRPQRSIQIPVAQVWQPIVDSA